MLRLFVVLVVPVMGFDLDFLQAFLKAHDIQLATIHTRFVDLASRLEAVNHLKTIGNIPSSFVQEMNSSARSSMVSKTLDFLTSDLPSVTELLQGLMEDCNQMQQKNCFFLIDVSHTGLDRAKNMLTTLSLQLDDMVFAMEIDINNAIRLYEVYKVRHNMPLIVKEYGNWTRQEGLHMQEISIWERRSDLLGLQFKIATLPAPPFILSLEKDNYTQKYEMTGMFPDVFHELQKMLNFSYELMPSIDGEWGLLKEDGDWTGMVGMLKRKDIDIAVTPFTVTKQRSRVITFAEPITQIYHSLLIRNPQGQPNFRAYSEPLQLKTWIALLGIVLISTPILFCTIRYGWNKDVWVKEFSLAKCCVYSLSVMTFMRPWHVTPSTFRGSLLVGGMLTYYHWEAMLVSYLANRVIVMPFHNLQGLLYETNYKITLTPGASEVDSFRFSNDPLWRRIYEERIEPDIGMASPSLEGQVEHIMTDTSFAMYHNFAAASTSKYYVSCDIVAIPQKYDIKPFAFGFQKNSPYLEIFNFYLRQLREKGIMKRILQQAESEPQVCPDYSGKALGFDSCFTAFLCLITGLGFSILALLLEQSRHFINNLSGCFKRN